MERSSKRQRVEEKDAHLDAAVAAIAASAERAAVDAASAAPSHLRLHRHALESIFAVLTLPELQLCSLVSSRWLEAVCSMRGIEHGRNGETVNISTCLLYTSPSPRD